MTAASKALCVSGGKIRRMHICKPCLQSDNIHYIDATEKVTGPPPYAACWQNHVKQFAGYMWPCLLTCSTPYLLL